MKAVTFGFVLFLALGALAATETIPPAPQHYFNDYVGVVSQSAAEQFDRQLKQFEMETSDQVVVAIFQKMQSDDDVAAYCQRVAQSWGVGQKDKRNGVVLFIFVEDRKTSIQVGYGLEGALPDVTAFDIRANQINPHFRNGDYEGGLAAGIDAIFKAIRGEYSGTGQIVSEHQRTHPYRVIGPLFFILIFFVLSVLSGIHRTGQGRLYSSAGNHWTFSWGDFFFFWLNMLLSSSGRSGGGGSSSGGGGFSGGGGSFGGGGSSGSW